MKDKKKCILFCILIFLPICLYSFLLKVDVGDEIINMQSTVKMLNGNLIYKDFNVIITPLFFYIGKMILTLFGKNIFVFRIYNVLIYEFLFIALYKLLKKLNVKEEIAQLGILFILVLSTIFIQVGANYNILAIAFYILGISLYKKDDNVKNILVQGILMFLVFWTKQNVGIYYVLAICLSNVILDKKEKIIKNILLTLKEIAVFGICVLISCVAMYLQGNLFEFVDYAFLGMKDFTNNNLIIGSEISSIIFIFLIASLLIDVLYIYYMKKGEIVTLQEKSILIFSIFLNLTTFPIANMYHLSFAIILNFVMLLVIINKTDIKSTKIILPITLIIYVAINVNACCYLLKNKNLELVLNKDSKFFGGFVNTELLKEINEVDTYIQEEEEKGNKVIIFSEKSPLYMIELNKNNGILDLPFNGNLGRKGVSGLIEKIQNMNNVKVLLNEEPFWQIPLKAREYVLLNMKKIGEIGEFSIYE